MPDFEFLQNPTSKKWVILAPRRAIRPDIAKGTEAVCPFCIGNEEGNTSEVVLRPRHTSEVETVRVIPNKFPFASIHEIVIHSPDHHKNFGELPLSQVELIFQTYRQRYNSHKDKGQVYIFHNRGETAGESLPHPHTQLAIVPREVEMDTPPLESVFPSKSEIQSSNFSIFCPPTSQWPDEVWVAPQKRERAFGEVTDEEIKDLSHVLTRLIEIFSLRHGHEFPFNFYIFPGADWYLRLIPRSKVLGGFEIGTGIFINTQDPKETTAFIKDHFENF